MAEATLTLKIWTEGRGRTLPHDLSDLAGLFAPHAEHIANLCDEGYQSGEIVDDKFSGWWSIERKAKPRRSPKAPDHNRFAQDRKAAL